MMNNKEAIDVLKQSKAIVEMILEEEYNLTADEETQALDRAIKELQND